MVGDSNASDQSNMGFGVGLPQIVKVIHDLQTKNILCWNTAYKRKVGRSFLLIPALLFVAFVLCDSVG